MEFKEFDRLLMLLAEKHNVSVSIHHAAADACNGYGWHIECYIELIKTIKYCPSCREKTGKNYESDYHPSPDHRHKHYMESRVVWTKHFKTRNHMFEGLIEFLEQPSSGEELPAYSEFLIYPRQCL